MSPRPCISSSLTHISSLIRNNTSELPKIIYQDHTTITFDGTNPAALPDTQFDVQLHFTEKATFDTMSHFHTNYTEYLYVERGSVRFTINGHTRQITPASGEMVIPAWTPHRWEVLGGCETVVMERTIPRDGSKEGFLRNFVSLINDYGGSIPQVPVLQVSKIFADWDNYPAPEGKFARERGKGLVVGLTKLVGGLAGLVGYRGVYKEYTAGLV
jgi:mannose-6-phosphate isomerase-like protein (cupin superfamily)